MKDNFEKNKNKTPGFIRKVQEVLVILVIIAIIVLIVFSRGFGKGNGSDDGDRSLDAEKNNSEVMETDPEENIVTTEPEVSETIIVSTEPETETVEIKVSGHDYLYLNSKIELSSFIDKLSGYEKDVEIRISADNTATMNTMEDLTEELDKNGFTNYYKVNE